MALAQHQGLGGGGFDYTSGAGPVGNTSGSAQQVGGTTTNRLSKKEWKLTPELIAEIQPYLSFDLAKVVQESAYMQSASKRYVVPDKPTDTGRGIKQNNRDVTDEYSAILKQIRSRDRPDVYGTAGFVSGNAATRAFHDVYGGRDQEGGSSIWHGTKADTFDDQAGVRYDAAGKPIARPQDQWNIPAWMQPGRPGFTTPTALKQSTYADTRARQFQVDHPGYFQVGENPNNPGSWDRGRLDTNNLPASYFPNGVADPNSMVKFDEKYGYIAPIALEKQERPDFLNKYGQYIPLAMFGAGVALSGMAAGAAGSSGAAGGAGVTGGATGGTFSGIGAGSTTGSLGLSSAGATGAATGSTVAGGTGIAGGISTAGSGAAAGFGIPAGGYAGAGITAAGQYTSGAGAVGNSAGTAQQVGSQGLFSQPAAPVSTGVPSSTGAGTGAGPAGGGLFGGGGSSGTGLLGQLGSALGGGSGGGAGGSGGGYAGLIGSLISGGASIYQARQIADSMQVQDKSTPYSSIKGSHVTLDDSIRGLENQSLDQTNKAIDGTMGYLSQYRARSDENKDQYDKLYAELTSNQNPFIQARTNPMRETIAAGRGQLQRSQGLRGIGGSSFADSALENYDFGGARALGDASSTATQEALGARSNTLGSLAGLNQNRLTGENQTTGVLNTLNSNRTGIANSRTSRELNSLGLSSDAEAAQRAAEKAKQDAYMRVLQGLLG